MLIDLLTVDPYHLDALMRLGELLEQMRRPDDAIEAYQRVLRFDPGHDAAVAHCERVAPDYGRQLA